MTETTTDVQVQDLRAQPSAVGGVKAWLRTDAARRWILAVILLVGAYLRLSHLNWDMGTHIHPDERFLTFVTSAMELPKNLGQFFDSTQSPMNPYNRGYDFFVYGTLPLFIVRVVAEFVQKFNLVAHLWTSSPGVPLTMTGYDGVDLVGRALSGIFDVGCIWLIYLIGRRLFNVKVALLAAALYAFTVLPLQQSHFYTVDTFGTFFALLTLYFAVRVARGATQDHGRAKGGGWLTYIALGASLGASIACRINLAPLAGIALLAAGIRAWDDWQALRGEPGTAGNRGAEAALIGTIVQATLFRLLLMALVTIAMFRVTQPYAFGGTSLLDFSLNPKFLDNMRSISLIVKGDADQPPIDQWANRQQFVFPFTNMVVWGMGLPLGIMAWAGWLLALWQIVAGLTVRPNPAAVKAHLIPVVWTGGMFIYHSIQFSYTMRYYLPIYPTLALMAAWFLWWLVDRARTLKDIGAWRQTKALGATAFRRFLRSSTPVLPGLAYGLLALVTIGTMLWGWGFLAIYRRPLTRVTASRWIYDNIPEGSVVANEHWDDGLPFSIDGKIAFKPAGWYYGLTDPTTGQRVGQIENYGEDTPEKRERLYQWLDEADVLALSSNRLWGSIPRLPMRYPMTTEYYKLLFEGKLGFKLAARFTSFPTIFGHRFDDTGAEEAFSVYDHPEVLIYVKTPEYSEALARSYFDKIDLEDTIMMTPKQVTEAPTALMMTPAEAAQQRAGGTWTNIFDEQALPNRSQAASTVTWLLLVELLGLAAFPLIFVVLRGLSDRGYGVSKTVGILALAWLSWIGPSLKIVPYERWWIALGLGLLIGVSAVVAWRRRRVLARFIREHAALLLTEEAIFLALFALFLLIRIGNPDLWHPARGGEKPMDFAFLNAVIRSTTFPPYDPWHAGGFINYYYFGFVIVGTLIKLTGILPWVAYNLAVPTLFALTGLGAFSVAFSLADGDRATEFPGEEAPYGGMRIGPLLAGLAGIFFVAIIGNLGNVKLLVEQIIQRSTAQVAGTNIVAALLNLLSGGFAILSGKARLDFPNDWWFWNASRVIPDTINEFPFFTFTYADLHAHMIALPLTLVALAATVALVRNWNGVSGTRVLGIRYSGEDANPQSPIPNPQSLIPNPQSPIPNPEPSPWYISLPELLPILLLGFVLGALRATNTWDFPTYALVGVIAISVLEGVRRSRMGWPVAGDDATGSLLEERLGFLFRAVVSVLWRAIIMVLVTTLAFYPYTKHYATAYGGLQMWTDAKTSLSDYLIVHGFFLTLGVIYLMSELVSQLRNRQLPSWLADALPWIVAAMIVLLGAGLMLKVTVWIVALPLLVLAVVLALGRDLPPVRRFGLLLLALALAITMGVEVIRLKDDIGRMNTVFKFYFQAWTMFGVATAYGLATWAVRALKWHPGWRRLAWGVTAVLLVGVMLYPAFAARAKVKDRFSAADSPHTLDGMAYMDKAVYVDNNRDLRLADDKAAMLWMMHNVQGSPVILEAQTPEYRWGSRFSIYTGLPTIQGWNWHERQQRSVVPDVEVQRRVSQVQELYSTTDLARAQHLMDVYNVQYVIVGELERAYYPPEGLAKFDLLVSQGYMRTVYQGGSVIIYEIVGRGGAVQQPAPTNIGPQPVPTPTEAPLPTPAPFESPKQ